jgi:hypothetical protein
MVFIQDDYLHRIETFHHPARLYINPHLSPSRRETLMKRFILVILLFSRFSMSADESLESLIEKINSRLAVSQRDSVYSCRVISKTRTMDKNWKPKTTTVIEKRMILNGKENRQEIIRAVEIIKGQETVITEKIQEKLQKSEEKIEDPEKKKKKELSLSGEDLIPFQETRRNLYEFQQLPDTLVQGVQLYCIRTRALEPSENVYEGLYLIQPETAAIVVIMIHPSKNPRFVKRLNLEMHFIEMPGDRWVLSKMHARVFADLLIKKIRMDTEEEYDNYRFIE